MRKILLLVAGLALVATACRAEANTVIMVEEDGSGTVVFEFGADEEFLDLLESTGADPAELFSSGDAPLPGSTATQRTEGDMSFWGFEWAFDDVDEISESLAGASDATGANFSDLSFEMNDDGAVFDARFATPTEELTGLSFDQDIPIGDLGNILSVNFVMGMPGTVVEHNADRVLSDGSLLWEIPITGGTTEMFARSEFGSSSLWWLWIVLGVVLLIGLAALIAAIIASRGQSKRAVDAAAAEDPAVVDPEPDDGTAVHPE